MSRCHKVLIFHVINTSDLSVYSLEIADHVLRYENSRLALFVPLTSFFLLTDLCSASSIGRRAAFRPLGELFMDLA